MRNKKYFWFVLLMVSALLLSSCTTASEPTAAPTDVPVEAAPTEPPAQAEEPAAADVALKITGLVANEMAWSEAEVRDMETMTVEAKNKDGETKSYTGVSLNALLALAAPSADAVTLEFIADDGYTAEITLAEVQPCTNCIVSFREQGGFSTVLPDFSSKVQVKGIVEIRVK